MPFPQATFRLIRAAALWVALLSSTAQRAQGQVPDENQLKAAFVFNFGKFVEWPEHALAGKTTLIICIVASDEIAHALGALVAGKTVNGRDVNVLALRPADNAMSCQILFIGRKAGKETKALLDGAREAVLTVGEEDSFAGQGGILNLLNENNKIRFQVNQEAAARAGLKISSKLLALAQIVHDRK
jgi:hypothetical protein